MNAWRVVRSHPLLVDGFCASGIAFVSLVALLWDSRIDDTRPPDLGAALLVLAMTTPIALRRNRPVLALTICGAAVAVYNVADYPPSLGELTVLVVVYSVAAHATAHARRTAAIVFFSTLLVFVVGGLVFDEGMSVGEAVGNWISFATAYVVGDNIRRRRERVADLEERAQRLDHERELEARDAAARERAAIARELHDVVAHSMTVMVVQAAAARRVLGSDPERAEQSIRVIEETGRESLVEMRRILGVLRNGDEVPALAPQPSLARIGELVNAEAATPVELESSGEPRPLPTAVDVSAYRIVQEALTNVRKHAGPARVRVLLAYGRDALEIRVDDDGRGHSGDSKAAGHGLRGIRERAALCGGAVAAGPRRGGGWSVVANLPYASDRAS